MVPDMVMTGALNRREFLVASTTLLMIGAYQSAHANRPTILAATAAITALAAATGNTANALEKAVQNGFQLRDTVIDTADRVEAVAAITTVIEKTPKIQKAVMRLDIEARYSNRLTKSQLEFHVREADVVGWDEFVTTLRFTAEILKEAVVIFYEKKRWFPESVQEILMELSRLYESNMEILYTLESLNQHDLAEDIKDIKLFGKLIAAYNVFRVRTLRLFSSLNAYIA